MGTCLQEEKFPKKYAVPFLALAWLSYASYTTLGLTIGVGCIGVQVITCPTCLAYVQQP